LKERVQEKETAYRNPSEVRRPTFVSNARLILLKHVMNKAPGFSHQ